jgi:hypothetical protein
MNPISGTKSQFAYGVGTDNGTTMALAGGGTSLAPISPRYRTMGTEALLSMRGWLLKRKNGVYDPNNRKTLKGILGGDFNKRFFWIDSSIRLIYYSESEDKSKRVSFIPFNRVISATPVTDPNAINTARPGWVYGIELRTSDRVYELWARTQAEARQWLEVMEKAASIGRASGASTGMTSYALGGQTSRFVDSLGPLVGGSDSRRGSAHSGSSHHHHAEPGNTIPVVSSVPIQGSGDDVTIVAELKENLELTANACEVIRSPTGAKESAKAPAKWDDWDR